MRKYIQSFICLIVVLYSFNSFGQDTIDTTLVVPGNEPPTMKFQANTELNYGSTVLNNDFIQKLLFGGRINDDLKNEALDKIRNKGRFGLEVNYDIKYINLVDTLFEKLPNFNYYLGFGSYNNTSASFTKDLFSTAFYGNKQFENETASLGKSTFISTKFEKITVGLISKDGNTSYGISLIIGDRINRFDFRKADMFTHPDGVTISMDYDGTVKLSNNEKTGGFMSFNGAGVGFDYTKKMFKHRLDITNFGFTIWSRNTQYSNTATQYDFEGVEIDNILQVTSQELELNARALLPELEKKPFVTLLPTIINLRNLMDDKKEFQPTYSVRYKLASNYFPYFNGGMIYKANQHLWLKGTLAYGGYSGLRAEFGAYMEYKKFNAGIESQNLTGMFMRNGNGNGMRIYLNTTF